jgi:hypothetical protein
VGGDAGPGQGGGVLETRPPGAPIWAPGGSGRVAQGTGMRAMRRRVSFPMRLVSLPTHRPWEVT